MEAASYSVSMVMEQVSNYFNTLFILRRVREGHFKVDYVWAKLHQIQCKEQFTKHLTYLKNT